MICLTLSRSTLSLIALMSMYCFKTEDECTVEYGTPFRVLSSVTWPIEFNFLPPLLASTSERPLWKEEWSDLEIMCGACLLATTQVILSYLQQLNAERLPIILHYYFTYKITNSNHIRPWWQPKSSFHCADH